MTVKYVNIKQVNEVQILASDRHTQLACRDYSSDRQAKYLQIALLY